jgi:hypothetical protein
MTEALERLSTVLTTAPPEEEPARLILGTVVQITPVIRVDSGSKQLACTALAACYVGETVWVLTSGSKHLIVGEELPGDGQWGVLGFTGGYAGTWGNFGSGFHTTSIKREPGGLVRCAGTAAAGSSGTILQIAAGWRPADNRQYPAVCAVAGVQVHARFEVTSAGVASAVFAGGGTAQFFSFDAVWSLY